MIWYQFVILLIVNFYRPRMDDTQSVQAGQDASNIDVVNNGVGDETEDNESMDGEQMEIFSVHAQSKHFNTVGKRSIVGPSANRNER